MGIKHPLVADPYTVEGLVQRLVDHFGLKADVKQ